MKDFKEPVVTRPLNFKLDPDQARRLIGGTVQASVGHQVASDSTLLPSSDPKTNTGL